LEGPSRIRVRGAVVKRNLAAMGKNQAYKAMQRSKMSTTNAAGGPGEEVDDGMVCILPPSIFLFYFYLLANFFGHVLRCIWARWGY
jgi:hypothetical protein